MTDFVGDWVLWIKALHIISVIAWMAGLLYLPRLFVYHADAEPGSPVSETLMVMERRLLRAIMTPAMVAAFLFGGLLLTQAGTAAWSTGWLSVKMVAVGGSALMHGLMAGWRRDFANQANQHPARFYRAVNEVPTVLMVLIVICVVVKPF